jgi:crotonobetainyl-CoA:carnitine CoA-transferase CaiB-like acyl-CoA transferase
MSYEHPDDGRLEQLGFPCKLSDTPGRISQHAPGLGEHTDELLASAGYSDADRKRLFEAGVVRTA